VIDGIQGRYKRPNTPTMAPRSARSSNSFSDIFSASTRPVSESAVPELDTDLSTTDDVTSDYLSTRTRSVLGPVIDHDDGFGSNPFDTASIYTPSHFPTVSITYQSADRSWEDAQTINSTRSITDLDVDYVYENGRRYSGSYYMPNDEDEQVRLQLLNQVYLKVFDGELTTVPLESPTHILDIGTGVGEWAIDMAEMYPDCEVTGTDISNIFERRVPQNVFWEIDDAELEWERPPNYYDLVHLRDLTGAFADWDAIYRSVFTCLKPGGWVEVLDFDDKKGLHDLFAYFESETQLYNMARDLQAASLESGRPRGVGHLEPRLLVNAGYVDVNLTEYSIPLKTQDGSTGKFWLLSCLNGMEPTCMRLLTKFKNWDPEEVRSVCDKVGKELMTLAQDPKRAKTFVVKLRVLTGRKPGHSTHWTTTPADDLTGPIRFNDDGHDAGSERACDLVESQNTLSASKHLRDPAADEGDWGQAMIPTTHELAENSSDTDGNGRLMTAFNTNNTRHTTEDWLRNVDIDHFSNDTGHDVFTGSTTDDAIMKESGKGTGDIALAGKLPLTTTEGRASSTSALPSADLTEAPNSQSQHLIPEPMAPNASIISSRSEPEESIP
jgi:SAM-dependent methyltransferase